MIGTLPLPSYIGERLVRFLFQVLAVKIVKFVIEVRKLPDKVQARY